MKKLLPILLLAMPVLANAQTAKKDSVRRLSNLVVTAEAPKEKPKAATLSRSNVPLEKLPISINTLDMSQLEDRGIFNPQDALRFVPAANIHKLYGAFLRFNVRGFKDQPVMIDGVTDGRSVIDNSYPMSDLSDVERIEVLKGPASVLQGHSSVGGILNIARLKATDKTTLGLRLDYGSWNNIYSVLKVGGKLSKHWNGLATVSYGKQDGWRSVGDKRFKVYGTLNGHWENDEIDIRASYNNDFYGTEAGLPAMMPADIFTAADNKPYLKEGELLPGLNRAARYNNESDEMYHKNFNMSVKYQHSFSDFLKLNEYVSFNNDDIYYFSTEELSYNKSWDAIYPHYFMALDTEKDPAKKRYTDGKLHKKYIDLAHVNVSFPFFFEHQAKTIQNQLSLDANFKTGYIKHNLSLGYDVSYMRRNTFKGWYKGDIKGPGFHSMIDALNPKSAGPMEGSFSKVAPQRLYSQGVFLNNLWEFGDKVQMMTAVRYDLFGYESSSAPTIDGGTRFEDPAQKDYAKTTSSALTYRFGLVYEPVKNVSVYTSFANIYKPYRNTFDSNTIYVDKNGEVFNGEKDGKVFDPRTGYQVEVGARASITDWLEVNASAFYILMNNDVRKLGTETVKVDGKDVEKNIQGQVGSFVSKGAELSLVATPFKGLHLEAGYSFTDAGIAKMADNKYMKADKNEGHQYRFIPKHQAYSLGSYEFTSTFLKGLALRYSVNFMDKRYSNISNTYYFDAYTQLDLGASYKFLKNHLTLAFDVYNVTNVENFVNQLYGQPFPNKPRNFMVSLRYNL